MNLTNKPLFHLSSHTRLPESLFITFVTLTLMLLSCDRNKLFEENKTIPNSSWNQQSALIFSVPVMDTTTHFNILLNIRNEGNYPYSNLYLFMKVISPAGNILTDTMDIDLADNQGKWYGTGLGDLSFLQVPYKTDIRFPLIGLYRFEIVQGMRSNNNALKGIRDVGIRIEKVKPKNSGEKE